MSFSFSAQNFFREIPKKDEDKKEYFSGREFSRKHIAISELKKELEKYDPRIDKDEIGKKLVNLKQIKYMNMKCLAAAIALLNIYNTNEMLEEFFDETVDMVKKIYNILINSIDKKNVDKIKIKQQIFIYIELLLKNDEIPQYEEYEEEYED